MRKATKRTAAATLLASLMFLLAACATPPTYTYVVEYQVVGDRTVKYIYVPGEESSAGSMFLDQALALEICGLSEWVEEADAETGEPERYFIDEQDCVTTRVLKTQEYR